MARTVKHEPGMLRFGLLVTLAGCELYFDDPPGADDGALPGTHDCPPHTATIFEPADGATVPTTFDVRMRWNEPGIPDRYMSMSDDYGNYFLATDWEVLGDGSTRNRYQLPAGGHFNFEIGWYCDAANDGPAIPLAAIRIHTQP